MTEAEWLEVEQFDDAMCSTALDSPGWSFRKQTLFSVACSQRLLLLIPDERGARLLAEFEVAALAAPTDLSVNFTQPLSDYVIEALYDPEAIVSQQLLFALGSVARGYISQVAESCAVAAAEAKTNDRPVAIPDPDLEERRIQAAIIRDIVGNPFRSTASVSEWRTDTAVALARQMYDSRDFSAMPILADALQDAGCDNDDMLKHCRDPQQIHARGCWVVDWVLGKE